MRGTDKWGNSVLMFIFLCKTSAPDFEMRDILAF